MNLKKPNKFYQKGLQTRASKCQSLYSKDQKKRPFPVINEFPKRDVPRVRTQIIPGNSKYSESVEFRRKKFIYGTSLVKGIRKNEFNLVLVIQFFLVQHYVKWNPTSNQMLQ